MRPAGVVEPFKQALHRSSAAFDRFTFVVAERKLREHAALTVTVNRGEWKLRFSQLGWANGDPDSIMGNFLFSQEAANTTSRARGQ